MDPDRVLTVRREPANVGRIGWFHDYHYVAEYNSCKTIIRSKLLPQTDAATAEVRRNMHNRKRRFVMAFGVLAALYSLTISCCPAQTADDPARVDRGGVTTELFGLVAEGGQFVYVLDRSASMGDYGGKPMQALRRELERSLAPLSAVQQFQVVFYNHQPRLLRLDRDRPTMIWANDEGKERALRFLQQIDANGGTDHLAALRVGLALRPDILFFLTDADRPQLSPEDLRTVSRLNGGTRIFAIELGRGEAPEGQSFLQELAEQSGGNFRYVDILQWEG